MVWYFIFAALIVVIDRLFKLWVAAAIAPHTFVKLIPGVIHLTYVENTGAAFSILSNMRWLLVAISAAAAVVIIYIIASKMFKGIGQWACAAILGGAIGNLVDRVLTGKVIDMFEPEFVDFAIFNIADIFITVGGIALIIHIIKSELTKKKASNENNA